MQTSTSHLTVPLPHDGMVVVVSTRDPGVVVAPVGMQAGQHSPSTYVVSVPSGQTAQIGSLQTTIFEAWQVQFMHSLSAHVSPTSLKTPTGSSHQLLTDLQVQQTSSSAA